MLQKTIPSVDYNYWLKRPDIQFDKLTKKVPKVVKPTNKKTFYKKPIAYR